MCVSEAIKICRSFFGHRQKSGRGLSQSKTFGSRGPRPVALAFWTAVPIRPWDRFFRLVTDSFNSHPVRVSILPATAP